MRRLGLLIIALSLLAAAPLAAQTTLTIWTDALRFDPIRQAGQNFADEYGIEIEVVEVPMGDMRQRMSNAAPAGEGPDILVGAHDWTGELAQNGLIQEISLTESQRDDFVDVSLEGFTYNGELWALPYAIESIAIFYNRDMVSETPETWDDVMEHSRQRVQAGDGQYGFMYPGAADVYHTFPFISAFGGYIFAYEEGEGFNPDDIGLATDGALQGLGILDTMYEENLLPEGLDYNTAQSLFLNGDASMFMTGPWAISSIEEAGIDYGVVPIPTMEGNEPRPFVGAQGFFVSAFTQNRVLANEFLKASVATEEIMVQIFENGNRPPAFLPALNQVAADDPVTQAFADAARAGIPMPNIPQMGSVWSQAANSLQLIAQQEQEPTAAMQDAVEGIEQALAGGQ
jgi:maltose-binding protein MalE